MMSEMALHAKKIRYQNLLHVTLLYNKYTIKEFFEIIEKEEVDIDPDSLVDGTDETFDNEFDKNLVKLAKEKLYPYREQCKNDPESVSMFVEPEEKAKFSEKVFDVAYALYDAPRRMYCGMKPFDNMPELKKPELKKPDLSKLSPKNIKESMKKKKEDKKEGTEEEGTNEKKVEIVDTDGSTIETTVVEKPELKLLEKKETEEVKETPKQEEETKQEAPKPALQPVNGIVNNDVQGHINMILQLVKDRVVKDTIITLEYNNSGGSYNVVVNFPDGTNNSFTVDAMTFLPDYYSILVSDKTYGTLAIPFETKVATKIIGTPMYNVHEEDIRLILKKYYLDDIGLYYVFDFSTFKHMDKMTKKQRKKLSAILADVADALRDKNTEEVPRFRISKFNSLDDFVITSDQKCKSPLGFINETSNWIVDASFDVKEGKVYQQPGNTVQQQMVA